MVIATTVFLVAIVVILCLVFKRNIRKALIRAKIRKLSCLAIKQCAGKDFVGLTETNKVISELERELKWTL